MLSLQIDNTNADVETRRLWINLAEELRVPIRCVYFDVPIELCRHNNAVRASNPSLVIRHGFFFFFFFLEKG